MRLEFIGGDLPMNFAILLLIAAVVLKIVSVIKSTVFKIVAFIFLSLAIYRLYLQVLLLL